MILNKLCLLKEGHSYSFMSIMWIQKASVCSGRHGCRIKAIKHRIDCHSICKYYCQRRGLNIKTKKIKVGEFHFRLVTVLVVTVSFLTMPKIKLSLNIKQCYVLIEQTSLRGTYENIWLYYAMLSDCSYTCACILFFVSYT